MSGQCDPISFPQTWDVITLAGVTTPLCEVDGFERENKYQVKDGKGVKGATITFVGQPPAKGTVEFKLWLPAHFTLMDQIRTLLAYDPTKQSGQALDIYHPALADIDVTSVVCTKVGGIKHEGNQLYTCKIELLEYFPAAATNSVSTPNGAAAGVNGVLENPHVSAQLPPTIETQLNNQITTLLGQAGAP